MAGRAWEQSRSSVPHSERVAFRGLAGSVALAAVSVGCGARNAPRHVITWSRLTVSVLGRVPSSLARGATPPINAAAGWLGTRSTTSANAETRILRRQCPEPRAGCGGVPLAWIRLSERSRKLAAGVIRGPYRSSLFFLESPREVTLHVLSRPSYCRDAWRRCDPGTRSWRRGRSPNAVAVRSIW